jgi:glyoxylase-like metal-dependent hydrolase (beta-lactamase superfamily II)
LPFLQAGEAELVDDGYELGLSLRPLPGHTLGQMGLQVEGRERAICCGDAIHSPLQVLNRELSTAVCVERDQARRVRRALLEEALQQERLIAPAHFHGARCIHLERTDSGFTPHFMRRALRQQSKGKRRSTNEELMLARLAALRRAEREPASYSLQTSE